jgi:hypothetical protein
MNKTLFYVVMAALIITSFVCLTIGAVDGKPAELWVALIACILLSCIFLVIVKGWSMADFCFVLLVTAMGFYLLSIFNMMNYILTYGMNSVDVNNVWVYALRSASIIWPTAVLVIGTLKPKKKSKKVKTKEKK